MGTAIDVMNQYFSHNKTDIATGTISAVLGAAIITILRIVYKRSIPFQTRLYLFLKRIAIKIVHSVNEELYHGAKNNPALLFVIQITLGAMLDYLVPIYYPNVKLMCDSPESHFGSTWWIVCTLLVANSALIPGLLLLWKKIQIFRRASRGQHLALD